MKIEYLRIENFRGIDTVELAELDDMVMIAGPNGCGKSCVLDAIRLLKSTYGGYQPNEAQQWFGEFKINLDKNPMQLRSLFRSTTRPLIMDCKIRLSDREMEYLRNNGRELVEEFVWKSVVPNTPYQRIRASIASELRAYKPRVDEETARAMPGFWDSLIKNEQRAFLKLESSRPSNAIIEPNTVLEVIFGSYKPGELGLVDFHGAHRNYVREDFGNINLNIAESDETLKQHALYNSGRKYTNIKSELAAAYVKSLIQEQVEDSSEKQYEPLTRTLRELFTNFFPGKEFIGPLPTSSGGLEFPVRLPNGLTHDINELSSGEKEVLFGYLRLRNTAPRDSVILLDEPELHLNPALVKGLPQFYHDHLGSSLGNQI